MSFDLPEVNDLVRVQLDDELVLPSRVEDVRDGELVLAAPRYVGNVTPPSPGDALAVLWTVRRGVSGLPAEFVTGERAPVPVWRVRVVGTIEVVQRRRYVRAAVDQPVTLSQAKFESIRIGHMLDLSEGGIRLRLTRSREDSHEQVVVRLALEDDVIDVPGTILRVDEIGRGFEEMVVQFEDDHRQATAIRRFVFREQARMRRSGLV